MVKEMAEQKKKEIDVFNKKVVVADKVFKVNTIIS
jgi:hydrogenase maturation factor